jgi:hypothetical protein
MMAMGHSMAGDEILKNAFANNAFEAGQGGNVKGIEPYRPKIASQTA